MKTLLLIIGYILIALSALTLIIELMPFEIFSEIIVWVYSVFVENDYHSTYFKVVPSTNSYVFIIVEFAIGLGFILSAKYISNKNNEK